jgi:hypothetical protein
MGSRLSGLCSLVNITPRADVIYIYCVIFLIEPKENAKLCYPYSVISSPFPQHAFDAGLVSRALFKTLQEPFDLGAALLRETV